MGNIESYLKWRCDLTFQERPFCEVDNLVLAEFAYLDLAGIVPTTEERTSISIKEAEALFSRENRQSKCASGPAGGFFRLMADSNRYREVRLSRFVELTDVSTQTDFSALQLDLGDGTVYVTFRGTSDSLMGWREDFSMSFQLMPSQKLAADYLKETVGQAGVQYRVGGHSKGGNLAVYAAMMLPEEKQAQVVAVYSNDGPGLYPELVETERYRAISHKLIRIVPEFCVIGALFQHEAPTIIVKSNSSGFHQHNGMTWQVEGDHFLCLRIPVPSL